MEVFEALDLGINPMVATFFSIFLVADDPTTK
jgi:hypothetical protein